MADTTRLHSSSSRRLLAQMPNSDAASFTEAQVAALDRALDTGTANRQPVDIRISIPFLRRRYFVVVLAGSEQRSAERRKLDREKHKLWTPANVMALGFGLLFIVPALIGIIHMIGTAVASP